MAHTQSLHEEEAHGSLSGYIAGFVLAVLLTAASFGLVMFGLVPPQSAMLVLAVLALAQIRRSSGVLPAPEHVVRATVERDGTLLYGGRCGHSDWRHGVGDAQRQHEHDVALTCA